MGGSGDTGGVGAVQRVQHKQQAVDDGPDRLRVPQHRKSVRRVSQSRAIVVMIWPV